MTSAEVRCPICRLRVRVSSAQMIRIDPASKCQHKQGWTVCPNMKLALAEARHPSADSGLGAASSGPSRGGPRRP
jgi:hypothetical protein